MQCPSSPEPSHPSESLVTAIQPERERVYALRAGADPAAAADPPGGPALLVHPRHLPYQVAAAIANDGQPSRLAAAGRG